MGREVHEKWLIQLPVVSLRKYQSPCLSPVGQIEVTLRDMVSIELSCSSWVYIYSPNLRVKYWLKNIFWLVNIDLGLMMGEIEYSFNKI